MIYTINTLEMRPFAFIILLSACLSSLLAQDSTLSTTATLPSTFRVGLTEAPPYCYQTTNNTWEGIAVDLWRQVAETLQISYELIEAEDAAMLLQQVQNNKIDVSLYTTMTAQNDSLVDFAPAYHHSTLAVALPKQAKILQMAKALFTPRFLKTVAWLAVILLVVGIIMWLLERKNNEDDFGDRSAIRGIGSGFWWAGVTMTTIGYGDKSPKTVGGRLVAMVWMLMAIGISATLTAAIVGVMDTQNSINFPNELKDNTVGILEHAPTIQFLEQAGIAYKTYPSITKGLEQVDAKELKAFVHSATPLYYQHSQLTHLNISIQKTNAYPHAFAFAVAQNSSLREPLSQAVLKRIMNQEWRTLLNKYK